MNKKGYVLFVTMIFLALATTIVTQLLYTGSLYISYTTTQIQREQAKQLALGGIACACSQLMVQDTYFHTQDDEQKTKKDPSRNALFYKKRLLETLLTTQYRWQTYTLTYEADGNDAVMQLCVMPEAGKIPLNNLYNYETHTFFAPFYQQQQTQQYIDVISEKIPFSKVEKKASAILADMLKQYTRPLVTITELLKHPACQFFADRVFFEPDYEKFAQKTGNCFFLADFFSVYSATSTTSIWMLSASVKKALGLDPFVHFSTNTIKKIIADYKDTDTDVKTVWNKYFKELYNKDFDALPKEIRPFLTSKFEPRMFSVLSYAKVGHVEQKLLAILEKDSVEKGEVIKMKKLYWL